MKLVLYSGGDSSSNIELDKEFLSLIKNKNPLLTFVPSSSYLSEIEFKEFVRHYSRSKIFRFIHFPVDVPCDEILFKEVLKSDVIHLGGGNTFYFLKNLKKSGLFKELKAFVQKGGILTGLSAGAIIMTEDIFMASYPEFDRDENSINLKNLKSLNLLDFYFFPHFKNSSRYDHAFQSYTRKSLKNIYACPDGSGIVVDQDKISFVGRTYLYSQGKKVIVN